MCSWEISEDYLDGEIEFLTNERLNGGVKLLTWYVGTDSV